MRKTNKVTTVTKKKATKKVAKKVAKKKATTAGEQLLIGDVSQLRSRALWVRAAIWGTLIFLIGLVVKLVLSFLGGLVGGIKALVMLVISYALLVTGIGLVLWLLGYGREED